VAVASERGHMRQYLCVCTSKCVSICTLVLRNPRYLGVGDLLRRLWAWVLLLPVGVEGLRRLRRGPRIAVGIWRRLWLAIRIVGGLRRVRVRRWLRLPVRVRRRLWPWLVLVLLLLM